MTVGAESPRRENGAATATSSNQNSERYWSSRKCPERFFGQLSYLTAQIADFAHGSDSWEQQLVPNWKRFLNDVLSETSGTRAPELIAVALIVLREHAGANPSRETGWIDLIEWAAIALWKAAINKSEPAFHKAVLRFWRDFYISELERFYAAHMEALGVERSIDQIANASSVGAVAASQIAQWHVARLGLLSLERDERYRRNLETGDDAERVEHIANWLAQLVNANESVLRPLLDIEHIQVFLMFETFRTTGRIQDLTAILETLERKLFLRRVSNGGLPFIDSANSLDNVFEQVATSPDEPLVTINSSYFVLALMEMCCALPEAPRNDLLGRIHRHLVLGALDVGEPGDRAALDLVSWIPPQDWPYRVLEGQSEEGEGVAVQRFGDTRDLTGAQVFDGLRRAVAEMRKAGQFDLPEGIPLAVFTLGSLRHRRPLPPELWRKVAFPPANTEPTAPDEGDSPQLQS